MQDRSRRDRTRRDRRRGRGGAEPRVASRHDTVVDEAVTRHGRSASATLPVLQDVQSAYGQLSVETLGAVADALGQSDAKVFGTATFYSMLSTEPRAKHVIHLCDGPVCCLRGSIDIKAALEKSAGSEPEWSVARTSCLGLCDRAPAALVDNEPCGAIDDRSWDQIRDGQYDTARAYDEPLPGEVRVAMQRIGHIDPESINSAIACGAYQGIEMALQSPPQDLLSLVEESGLRGCGGAGFPTGQKWRMVAQADATTKYVVCNADESEPGAFKDRVLIEGDPHRLIEGMLLAAYAVGASEGIIYLRGEYDRAARLLTRAIEEAQRTGWLGSKIGGRDFVFQLHLHRGAGAYVCGEETAMLESLEGRRGEPRVRPPYPTTHGYLGRPTVVNNVETLCHVPALVTHGPEHFRSWGTETSPGTKLFCVSGHVNRPGVFEVPYGVTLRQSIDDFAGGMRSGLPFKMALCGGAAGTIVPEKLLDVPIDFASQEAGVALGSGVIVAIDQSVSVVTLLVWLLHFFEAESCGKCTPCRVGTFRAKQILQRIDAGNGRPGDCDELAQLANLLKTTSLCGLGQSVAWPLESALEHFRDDFIDRGAS